MLTFDNIQPARLLIWQMKIFGMWTFNENKMWNRLYRTYGWLLHFHFTFLFILAMFLNVGTAQTLSDLSDALYMSLTETAFLVKVTNVLVKSRFAVHLLKTFEESFDGSPKNKDEMEIARRAHVKFCRLRNTFTGGSAAIVILSGFTPVFDKNYGLPFPCWMPFDYKNDENYYYAYTYILAAMMITAGSNLTLDLLQSYLLLQLSIFYRTLGYRLRNFDPKKNDRSCTLDRLFDFHCEITRWTSECEKFVSLPVFAQMVLSAFVICFTVYKLQNMDFSENPSAFLMFILFAMVMALQIYLPCNYGNDLTISAYDLTNEIYGSDWTHLPLETQKKIFIYMEYLKRPVVVKACKIFNIGLNVFSQIMNNAYRLYALLVNMELK